MELFDQYHSEHADLPADQGGGITEDGASRPDGQKAYDLYDDDQVSQWIWEGNPNCQCRPKSLKHDER